MVGTKQEFLGVTPPNIFYAQSFDTSVHFVNFDMSETFLSIIGHFFKVRQKVVVILIYGQPSLRTNTS